MNRHDVRLQVDGTKVQGVLVIQSPFVREDLRGQNVELYNEQLFRADFPDLPPFLQDSISVSRKNVLRGFHGDAKTWKLVTCLDGSILLAVFNPETFAKDTILLSDNNRRLVLIPPGIANAHLVLSDSAIFHYKLTRYTDADQFTIRWDSVGIRWPVKHPILSDRDADPK